MQIKDMKPIRRWLFALASVCLAPLAQADTVRVAVATNFVSVMQELAEHFEQHSGHDVTVSSGATGKLYAQIKKGAPFDLFFAADEKRPRLLELEGAALKGSRFSYAEGELVLWSPDENLIHPAFEVLENQPFRHLAMANPKTAPYGRAARQTLENLRLWASLEAKLVRGENIGQAYQFVHTGNAELGFVAKSQVYKAGEYISGSYWTVPKGYYEPIIQQAVRLTDSAAAAELVDFIRSDAARVQIESYGYRVPR